MLTTEKTTACRFEGYLKTGSRQCFRIRLLDRTVEIHPRFAPYRSLPDTAHADAVTRAHCEAFGDINPASTAVGVALLKPYLGVEIEACAILPR